MLDIKFIREHPNLIADAARKKGIDFDIKQLLKVDEGRRAVLVEVETIRREMNVASEVIAKLTGTEEKKSAVEKMREVKKNLAAKEALLKKHEEIFNALMLEVPNIPDPSVPEGKSDADNIEIRSWGGKPIFDFTVKDHVALMQDLGLLDMERGAKVSGTRGTFLLGDALALSFALWRVALNKMVKEGFIPMLAPALVRRENLTGTGWFPQSEDDIYKTQDDLYLSGTAEVPMMGYHAGEVLAENELPKKYVAFSPCFRREVGSYGKDTKGVFRLHEFYKIEQVVLCKADHQESVRLHEEMTAHAEKLMRVLQIPYRVVINSGGDLGLGQVKKYDIEAWIPSESRYRETHSASYFHDFQTRRFSIRYKASDGALRFAHSLNSTAIATPRILEAFLENHQQADGSVSIPEVLRPFVGKESIVKQK